MGYSKSVHIWLICVTFVSIFSATAVTSAYWVAHPLTQVQSVTVTNRTTSFSQTTTTVTSQGLLTRIVNSTTTINVMINTVSCSECP